MSRRAVLAVGAHPDDEVLGLGGTLARHVAEGDEVHALILCEGLSLRYPEAKEDFIAAEGHEAARVLGLVFLDAARLPRSEARPAVPGEIAAPIERKIRELRPSIVYTHWRGEINQDHVLVHEATLVAARCKERPIESLFAYETPSETEWGIPYDFSPNLFVEVEPYLDTKLEGNSFLAGAVGEIPSAASIMDSSRVVNDSIRTIILSKSRKQKTSPVALAFINFPLLSLIPLFHHF